jgi:hypothetical protein
LLYQSPSAVFSRYENGVAALSRKSVVASPQNYAQKDCNASLSPALATQKRPVKYANTRKQRVSTLLLKQVQRLLIPRILATEFTESKGDIEETPQRGTPQRGMKDKLL